MKVISRTVVKMPKEKGNVSQRYEIELSTDKGFYNVVRFKYVSRNLQNCEAVIVTRFKDKAKECYCKQINAFIDIL